MVSAKQGIRRQRRRTLQSATTTAAAADRLVQQIVERLRGSPGDSSNVTPTAIKELVGSSTPELIADRLSNAALECAKRGEVDLEAKLAELALDVARKGIGGKTLSVARCLDLLVDAKRRMKDFATAIALCQEALQIREAILDKRHLDVAENLRLLGELEHEVGNHRAAKSLLIRALAIRRAGLGPTDQAIGRTLSSLARAEIALGDFAAAVPHCQEALRIKTAEFGEQHPQLIDPLNMLATACCWSGRDAESLLASERAMAIVEANFGVEDERLVLSLCNVSQAALCLGRHHQAYSAAARALNIQSKRGAECDPTTARAAAALGSVMLEIGELHGAEELFESALRILQEFGASRRETAQALVNLGLVHAKLGNDQSARDQLENALALVRGEAGGASTAGIIANLALVNGRLGDRSKALVLHRQALQIDRRRLGEASEDVGLNLLAIGTLECGESGEELGLDNLIEGMAILLSGDDPSHLAQGYRALGEVLGRRSKSAAIFFEKLAINGLQTMRREIAVFEPSLERAFIGTREHAYRGLGDALIAGGRLPEAQQIITMIKEQELFQLTRGAFAAPRTQASLTPFEDRWRRRIDDIRDQIKSSCAAVGGERTGNSRRANSKRLREALRDACATLVDCLRLLRADFERLEPTADEQAPPTPNSSKQIIVMKPAANIALVHYLLAPTDLRIMLTTADFDRAYHVGLAEGEINRLVYAMRSAIQEQSEEFMPAARRLYTILVAPFVRDLASTQTQTLALALDGVLRYLPMAALHNGARYLVEDFSLLVATSAIDPSPAKRGTTATEIRGVGLGASRSFDGRPPFPGVREELAAVIRDTDASTGVVPGIIRLDEDFTAAALREALASDNAIVHVASHFAFAVAQELASYLQLGDGTRLTLAELRQMPFDGIDLVTLSACNTAVAAGHHQSGREVEGLGALVRGQGARNVVATLWPVADLTSAALMRVFYQNRYTRGLSLPEALRQAQVSLLRGEIKAEPLPRVRGLIDPDDELVAAGHNDAEPDHPFFWAPYVLMGDAVALSPSS